MFLRRLLVALGILALVAGIGLFTLWARSSPLTAARQPAIQHEAVLAAAKDLPPDTLLRSDDLRWTAIAADTAPPGSFVRGQAVEGQVTGSATLRAYREGEVLVADQLIRPGDPGFLPAVLSRGMRAISLAVDAAEGGAGLLAPGDHVDVVLTQTFTQQQTKASMRTVGETVLRNLRVLAVDQTISSAKAAQPGESRFGVTPEARLPKTVTVEVTVQQAEELMVAEQLGKLQLTLRSLPDSIDAKVTPLRPAAAWASDVSPSLLHLDRDSPQSAAQGSARSKPPSVVIVVRASKAEEECFDPRTGIPIGCDGLAEDLRKAPLRAGHGGPSLTATPPRPAADASSVTPKVSWLGGPQ